MIKGEVRGIYNFSWGQSIVETIFDEAVPPLPAMNYTKNIVGGIKFLTAFSTSKDIPSLSKTFKVI